MQVNTKSLKKQLAAAIAMLLVAVVALGTATYAWFVSNNTVDATTTSISAQSNAAYLVIANAAAGGTSINSISSTTASELPADKSIFPAQVTAGRVWQTAYASATGASAEKDETRFTIQAEGKTDGSDAAAVASDYAIENTFYIGTGTYAGEFNNLKVSNVEVTGGTSELVNAVRVLVVCDDKWCVWGNGNKVSTYVTTAGTQTLSGDGYAPNSVIADTVGLSGGDKTVKVYVYYDGADENVNSDNLANLTTCGINITFDATPVEFGKTTN